MRNLLQRLRSKFPSHIDFEQRKPVIFIHIPKTAGSTTLELFRKYYEPSFTSYDDHLRISSKEMDRYQFVSGHFSYDYCRTLVPSRFSFTFLREPKERLISLYYHNQRMKSNKYEIFNIARENSLEDYLQICLSRDDLRGAVWNNQMLTLAGGRHLIAGTCLAEVNGGALLDRACGNLEKLNHIGLVDTYDHDIITICDSLSIPRPRMAPHTNKTENRPSLSDLSATAQEIISYLVQWDERLYKIIQNEKFTGAGFRRH